MTYYQTRSHVGPDAKVSITLPAEMANSDVRITVEAAGSGPRKGSRPANPAEWRKFLDQTAGSIPDLPEVDRPGPDSYERRESWDD